MNADERRYGATKNDFNNLLFFKESVFDAVFGWVNSSAFIGVHRRLI
jgi:hypothetical protein